MTLRDRLKNAKQYNYDEAIAKLEALMMKRGAVSPMLIDEQVLINWLSLSAYQVGLFMAEVAEREQIHSKKLDDRPCSSPFYKLTWT